MTQEEIKPFLGKRVLVRDEEGTAYIGYLGNSQRRGELDIEVSDSHPELERTHQLIDAWRVRKIEELSPERERELRAMCRCTDEDPHSWVGCPLHGPEDLHPDRGI